MNNDNTDELQQACKQASDRPLTFRKRMIRAQRILFWQSFVIWIVLSLAIFGMIKLFWHWI
jgi:cell division septal protein FtsQ